MFPAKPEAVTVHWLSEVLGKTVKSVRVERFGAGVGIIALVTRLHLEYSGEPGPKTLIAKFTSTNLATREVARTYDMYGREHRFYSSLRERVAIRTPGCYFSEFRAEDQTFALLIEDLVGLRLGDQIRGATLPEAKLLLSALARLHAGFWGSKPGDPLIPWVPLHNNSTQIAGMQGGVTHGWPVILRDMPQLVPPRARLAAEKLPAAIPSLLARLCDGPLTLVHADVRLDNVFFAEDSIAMVDWQSVALSAPEQDLAYFITQSLTSEVRRAHTEELLRFYVAELKKAGVATYGFAECYQRFRLGATYMMCYAVTIAGTLDMGNERGKLLAEALLGRSLAALDEMDAFALLD